MPDILFIDLQHAMYISIVKVNETIISEQINAKFLLLSAFYFNIYHIIKMGQYQLLLTC